MPTNPFEQAYIAYVKAIQAAWAEIDVDEMVDSFRDDDGNIMQGCGEAFGCLASAGSFGTLGTGGGCLGTFGTLGCFGSVSVEPDTDGTDGPDQTDGTDGPTSPPETYREGT